MTHAAAALTITAAALLLVASWHRGEVEAALGLDTETDAPPAADWIDEMNAGIAAISNAIAPTPAAGMMPSEGLRAMLKQGEALRLVPYRLGDGGQTIGYGRYYPDGGPAAPGSITRQEAEEFFDADLEARAARWVRAYVSAPLQQHEFDALCHMAYNLRPASFKTIADAVNAGSDPEAASLQFIRAGSSLERGLRNRRAVEIALYRQGTYA